MLTGLEGIVASETELVVLYRLATRADITDKLRAVFLDYIKVYNILTDCLTEQLCL